MCMLAFFANEMRRMVCFDFMHRFDTFWHVQGASPSRRWNNACNLEHAHACMHITYAGLSSLLSTLIIWFILVPSSMIVLCCTVLYTQALTKCFEDGILYVKVRCMHAFISRVHSCMHAVWCEGVFISATCLHTQPDVWARMHRCSEVSCHSQLRAFKRTCHSSHTFVYANHKQYFPFPTRQICLRSTWCISWPLFVMVMNCVFKKDCLCLDRNYIWRPW